MTHQFTTIKELRDTLDHWESAGESLAFVPTMGALHAGHLTLVAEAKRHAKRVIVSIFVNPTQFGPQEDFNQYPRTVDADIAQLTEAGADGVWLPTVEEIYPNGPRATLKAGTAAEGLEGAVRPGHFDGVVTVVARLFEVVRPKVALFGEKDYQQLCVIRQMVEAQKFPVDIIAVPTIREEDGLAMSSRNRYLSPTGRALATRINQVLRHSAYVMKTEGRGVAETLEKAETLLQDAGFDRVDYVALRDATTLAPLTAYKAGARLLVAVRLGATRLIDNIEV